MKWGGVLSYCDSLLTNLKNHCKEIVPENSPKHINQCRMPVSGGMVALLPYLADPPAPQ